MTSLFAVTTLTVVVVAVVVVLAAVLFGAVFGSRVRAGVKPNLNEDFAERALDEQFERPRNEGDLL